MLDTLSSPAVQNFSGSLPKSDKKAFASLLDDQKEITKSEFEAFSSYPTTKIFVRCALLLPQPVRFPICADRQVRAQSPP